MRNKNDEFIWSQKYRPKTIEECILPVGIKNTFKGFVANGEFQNILLAGTAGLGKTTVALALCEEIGADVLFIPASIENGIDVVRDKLMQFASTTSLASNLKVVILDEVDRASANFQDGLKTFMETFSKNTRFILTTNHKGKIIEPLQSRCTLIEFNIPASEKPQMAGQLFKRLRVILDENGVTYDPKVVVELVNRFFPDNRKIINELQRYSTSGIVDVGILANFSDTTFNELVGFLKKKDFGSVRKWVSVNSDMEPRQLFSSLYSESTKYLENASIPELVLILSKYSYQSNMVMDHEINNVSCMVEIMQMCNFK